MEPGKEYDRDYPTRHICVMCGTNRPEDTLRKVTPEEYSAIRRFSHAINANDPPNNPYICIDVDYCTRMVNQRHCAAQT